MRLDSCEKRPRGEPTIMDNATAQSIGPLLRRVRLNDHRSLDSVADALGLSEHSIARYEHGADFSVTIFLRWCTALHLHPAEVVRAAALLGSAAASTEARPSAALGGQP
jgi:transcriptional regulator with XRE-family HTH domain